jgi:hypothetical protein
MQENARVSYSIEGAPIGLAMVQGNIEKDYASLKETRNQRFHHRHTLSPWSCKLDYSLFKNG